MTVCSRETGQLFLAGQLDERHEAAFEEHLESCGCCRTWLEEDAGDATCWQLAKELSHGAQAATDVVDPSSSMRSHEKLGNLPRLIAAYLGPSDDPSMMGRLGAYEIVGVIGRGGMGIVLKAFETSLSRNIAIKVLDPTLASVASARKRFAGEAKAMAAISHEHVVPIYAVDQYQDLPYFVMEYVVGGTLESRMQRDGPLDIVSIVRISVQVAEALSAAHDQGLVHRDIKPGNILLDRGTERVRVADFGLARVASDASYTCSGMIAGTPQYMSPEQAKGEACDARSDLFSLGSLMYAMCTGHAPFRGETVYGIMQRIIHHEPRSLRQQNPTVPTWLEQFIQRLLCKAPDKRFQSAEQVASILRLELAHLQNPTQVKQPSRDWVWRPVLSNRYRTRLVASLAAVLLIMAVSIPTFLLLRGTGSPGVTNGGSMSTVNEAVPANNAVTLHDGTELPDNSTGESFDDIPLWEVDGLQQAQTRITELEDSFYGIDDHDPWSQDANRLRQQLQAMDTKLFD